MKLRSGQATSVERSRSGDPERIAPRTPDWDRGYPDHIQRYDFVARQSPQGSRVLDAGCGCGYGAAYLVDHGATNVVAVDVAPSALDIGRELFHREQIVWLQEDCHTLEAASAYAPYDVVCNLENIEHLKEPALFLRRVTQVLKPEGIFIVSSPHRLALNKMRGAPPEAPPRNPFHFREYTADEFRGLLQRHFNEVTMWYQCHTAATRARLAVISALSVIWSNPALRVGRWIQRVIRRRQIPRTLDELLLLPAIEWEILDTDPGGEITWTFIAVCRQPRDRIECTS